MKLLTLREFRSLTARKRDAPEALQESTKRELLQTAQKVSDETKRYLQELDANHKVFLEMLQSFEQRQGVELIQTRKVLVRALKALRSDAQKGLGMLQKSLSKARSTRQAFFWSKKDRTPPLQKDIRSLQDWMSKHLLPSTGAHMFLAEGGISDDDDNENLIFDLAPSPWQDIYKALDFFDRNLDEGLDSAGMKLFYKAYDLLEEEALKK